MSLKKRYLKSKPVCKVTFEMPAEATIGAQQIYLAGEFNDWNTEATRLTKKKNGLFSVTLDLSPGTEYQYRYLLDQQDWQNDWDADKYVGTSIPGVENSVVIV